MDFTNSTVRGNIGFGPDAIDALTVSASPMTYTLGPRPEKFWIIGGTWNNVRINGQIILTGPGGFDAEPGDTISFTYTAAPTAIKRRKL